MGAIVGVTAVATAVVTVLAPSAAATTGAHIGAAATGATSSWGAPVSNQRLAASVLFGCADSRDRGSQLAQSRAGVAGIVLLGTRTPANLKGQLRQVRAVAPGQPPVIASDEEGGSVQRLASAIYRLPSAETMGTWSDGKIRRTAARYGRAMAQLGVRMSLAPVADLRVPGSYIDDLGRGFSTSPGRVGRAVVAWSRGLESAGVIPVVKHWPGHGHAVDTHQFAARIPALSSLQSADLIPFRMAFNDGADAVMVGHLQSKGLTKQGQPATQSRQALSLLREQAGPDTVIVTDSLSMAAASSARGLSESQAVIASLRAGADWAMVCSTNTLGIVKAVGRALRAGSLDRDQLVASSRRIHELTSRN